MNTQKIVILGGGISGLIAAYRLKKNGIDITLLEANAEPGGTMRSVFDNGYLIDYGPNSGLETTPLIKEIVNDLNLQDEFVYADETGNKRYILKNGELYALPTSPPAFFKTKLFSTSAKLRLLAEPFIGKSEDGYYQSIAQFVERRLGKEFLTYAIDPFVSGVYAGDPNKLSVKSAFPKLYALEEKYGGLIKGMIKGAKERKRRAETSKQNSKMFSFKSGMQTLPKALAKYLSDEIIYGARAETVVKNENGKYVVKYKLGESEEEIMADNVISALPAYAAASVFENLDENLPEKLRSVFYPKVMVLYLGYDKKNIGRELDGFGFLIPGVEKKKFLGAIWSSVIFPNRAPEGKAAFTLFIGGARKQDYDWDNPEKIIEEVLPEFSEIMKIKGEPDLVRFKVWQKAIPQYNLGYVEIENYCEKFERENPGIFLTGNFRRGISVGDCIKNNGDVENFEIK